MVEGFTMASAGFHSMQHQLLICKWTVNAWRPRCPASMWLQQTDHNSQSSFGFCSKPDHESGDRLNSSSSCMVWFIREYLLWELRPSLFAFGNNSWFWGRVICFHKTSFSLWDPTNYLCLTSTGRLWIYTRDEKGSAIMYKYLYVQVFITE